MNGKENKKMECYGHVLPGEICTRASQSGVNEYTSFLSHCFLENSQLSAAPFHFHRFLYSTSLRSGGMPTRHWGQNSSKYSPIVMFLPQSSLSLTTCSGVAFHPIVVPSRTVAALTAGTKIIPASNNASSMMLIFTRLIFFPRFIFNSDTKHVPFRQVIGSAHTGQTCIHSPFLARSLKRSLAISFTQRASLHCCRAGPPSCTCAKPGPAPDFFCRATSGCPHRSITNCVIYGSCPQNQTEDECLKN